MVELARDVRAKMRVEVAVCGQGNARAAERNSFESVNQAKNKVISLRAEMG